MWLKDREVRILAGEELEQKITPEDRADWDRGTIEDWVMQSHRLARTVAYGDLGAGNPPVISRTYEGKVDSVVEFQLERAGVRLAFILDRCLH